MLAPLLLLLTPPDQLVRGRFRDPDTPMPYVVSLPRGYADTTTKWPAVLYLHGGGLRGDNVAELERYGLLKDIKQGRKFPFILIAPQCPAGNYWRGGALVKLIDSLTNKYRIDSDRVYATGLSLGGSGTWAVAVQVPNRFAAVIPICGAGDPLLADRLKDLPIWIVHGDKDDVMPLETSRWMFGAIRRTGGAPPRFDIIEGAGHDVWTEFYKSDEWWKWMLEKKRKG
jgi:predicted peptidase